MEKQALEIILKSGQSKMFLNFGLPEGKVIFNQQNKACLSLSCVWLHIVKEMVHDLESSNLFWMCLRS